MAFKRQHDMMATFSMASMTDVIFLLLIFFMVTSTFVLPTGMEVNLPSSNQQTSTKPTVKVYIDSQQRIAAAYGDAPLDTIATDQLGPWLVNIKQTDPTASIALYADQEVPYGKIIDLLNVAADNDMTMVLATQPVTSRTPQATAEIPADQNEN
ncbi:MAG: biopolymer transporter ExbD [Muribaculaceae bacterium]|nr:biopolymer transporter ExbD [Muribaculaceae bacterium]MDE6321912.1 biopolymer transporter ExbD [Muribaculaceae bacterium]